MRTFFLFLIALVTLLRSASLWLDVRYRWRTLVLDRLASERRFYGVKILS